MVDKANFNGSVGDLRKPLWARQAAAMLNWTPADFLVRNDPRLCIVNRMVSIDEAEVLANFDSLVARGEIRWAPSESVLACSNGFKVDNRCCFQFTSSDAYPS